MKPISELKTASDFIEFFEAIPEELWITGEFGERGRCCAAGYLGMCEDVGPDSPQWKAWDRLDAILGERSSTALINDGGEPRYQQPTPKQRILAALRDAKEAGR